MPVLWWVVIALLSGVLMGFTAYASIVGGIGAASGGCYERCPRCGRHGLAKGPLHSRRCPEPGLFDRAVHTWPRHLHLGSH